MLNSETGNYELSFQCNPHQVMTKGVKFGLSKPVEVGDYDRCKGSGPTTDVNLDQCDLSNPDVEADYLVSLFMENCFGKESCTISVGHK